MPAGEEDQRDRGGCPTDYPASEQRIQRAREENETQRVTARERRVERGDVDPLEVERRLRQYPLADHLDRYGREHDDRQNT